MKAVKDDDVEEYEDSKWYDGMWDFLKFLVSAITLVLIVYFGSK